MSCRIYKKPLELIDKGEWKMFVYAVFGAVAIGLIFGAYLLISSILNVMSEKFEELMPERMVDFSGFVDLKFDK